MKNDNFRDDRMDKYLRPTVKVEIKPKNLKDRILKEVIEKNKKKQKTHGGENNESKRRYIRKKTPTYGRVL